MGEIRTFEQIFHRPVILNNSRDPNVCLYPRLFFTHIYLVGEDADG